MAQEEKQEVNMVDLEEGTQPKKDEPKKDQTMEEPETGYVSSVWTDGLRIPKEGTDKVPVFGATGTGQREEVNVLWPTSIYDDYCCIYRVPSRLRRVKPEAYTPQMLLIGPLHHYDRLKSKDLSLTDLRYLEYYKMEIHKKKYLENITDKYGVKTVDSFKKTIEKNEKLIRASYAESTEWIQSEDFNEMILLDSVFILGYFIQIGPIFITKTGDFLLDQSCQQNTILEDLILLENQLPYALLDELFEPFFKQKYNESFRDCIVRMFGYEGKIEKDIKFKHFTDLMRWVRVQTLGLSKQDLENDKLVGKKVISSLHNVDKLDSAGVDFKGIDKKNELSLEIKFENRVLILPCLTAADDTERIIRNMMALEQCHYTFSAYVCDYITFLDFLIDSEQDVALLVKKEIIRNWLGQHRSVTEMVNSLCLGIVYFGSHYYNVAEKLNKHYDNRLNRSLGTLRRVYFKDLWTGTAHVVAVFLLVLSLIQTVTSILQVKNEPSKSSSPPAPVRKP